ncbi:MAG: hypothetical protein JOY69_08530 [Candidatus Eremiobacteraeota bacterium]|nr:hypothetical protein [Candidatus Eremiobacteraeota bacterium]
MNLAVLAVAALAAVHLPVTTADASAQSLVDRGLLYVFAYDGGDAALTFAKAAERDPHLAIAYWGEALADGPDLNTPMSEERFTRSKNAIERAVALEGYAGETERRYIDAMAERYGGTWADWTRDNASYRAAMANLSDRLAGTRDDVAIVLAAEALLENGGFAWTGTTPSTPDARKSLALVEDVLADDPANVMANHLCVHLYDGAHDRTPAEQCAKRLDAAVLPPQAEHLAHMPAHFWIETGNYAAAVASSERAFRLFTQLQKIPDRDPDHDRYFIHDVYVGYSAAMMLDDYAIARVWSARMGAAYGTSFDALTALRFGRYDEAYVLARGSTPAELAVRGIAAAELGYDAEMHAIAQRLRKLTTSGDLVALFFARVAERDGDLAAAGRWIDAAVKAQRDTFADELIPLVPALEARGAFAMRHAAYSDAAAAYRAALTAYPDDPRAAAGLAAALNAQNAK